MTSTYRSVAALFVHRANVSADKLAFQYPAGESWAQLTWRQTLDRVRNVATGLKALGLQSEERCGILSSTRIEWVLADLGIMCAGGATTTVYPSNTAKECAYILTDSETRFVFAEDAGQVDKLLQERAQLGNVAKVIVFEGSGGHDGWVMTLAELEALGREHAAKHPALFDETVASVQPQHLATLIYTSGTTGVPKGVELTHDCWVFESDAMAKLGVMNADDHQYLWLPLSHSFGKVLEVGQLAVGFATTIDGRIPKLVENLGKVRPTFMAAAPRIFEKVYNKVVSGAQQAGGLKFKIFTWSLGVGRQCSQLRQQKREPAGLLALKEKIADKLVFSKLKARFGGRIRFFISGSAPLSREMAEFFHAAGILIIEGYGLTESSAASFVNRPESFAFGSVGLPLDGVGVKLAPEDGEILLGGRGIMRGYHNKAQETAEVLTGDGWLRTGDIGELDASGILRITDRKKDLIKTSGGKYVAPQHLESSLKALCPYISQVVVHGNARNFCSALVTIDEESIAGWKTEQGLNGIVYRELVQNAKVVALVQEAVNELNTKLASYETIKKFALLPADLSIETGELTPSMKVKRKAVEQKYKNILDAFYEGAVHAV